MKKIKVGDSEMAVLQYVANHPDCSIREAGHHFAKENNWGLSTVQKTLDRLRQKGLIERVDVDSKYRYRSTYNEEELQQALVHDFLSQSMGGSVTAFLMHVHSYPNLSAEDIEAMRKLVDKLDGGTGE